MANIKSYTFQIISVLLSFVNVKMILDFLGDGDYANWLIIFSIAGLVYALDLGIGSSVRNQLARYVAKNASSKSRAKLVFTYYKLIFVLAIGFCLVATGFSALAHAAGWLEHLRLSTIFSLTILIFIDFISRAHHPVFAGLQQPHSTNFALAAIQMFIFMALYFLLKNADYIENKLLVFSVVVFGGSIIINTLMLVWLNHLVPLFSVAMSNHPLRVSRRQWISYIKRGLPFFILQIEFAILGQITIYFIYANFPNETVVEMAIADKVFSPFIILATIIMYPFWSSYTLIMHRGEFDRARRLLRQQEYLALVCLPMLFLSIFFYDQIVLLWLDREVETTVFAMFSVLKVFSIFLNSIYSYFLNGVGRLRPQLQAYTIGLFLALPILYLASSSQNVYVCLSVTPAVLIVSAIMQRYFVFNVVLNRDGPNE